MIREEKEKYKIKLTKEVMEDRGNGSVWKNINKLMGKRTTGEEKVKIYREGKVMEVEEALENFFEFWRLVYNLSKNEIGEVWDEERMEELVRIFGDEERGYNRSQEEHLDTTKSARNKIRPMVIEEMGEGELKERLNNLKNNKAAGPDKIKAELFKELGKRKRCREVMVGCFNSVLGEREVPEAWRKSRTTMIR